MATEPKGKEAATATPAAVAAQSSARKSKAPGFVDSFWSADYAGGLGVLFQKLQQGVVENQQVLTIATLRAEAEEVYSERLGDIAPTIDRVHGGFARDDGASVRKAYEGVRSEMIDATKNHQKIADNIRELVVNPFSRWCDAHAQRVQNSQDDLQSKVKSYDRQVELVKRLRSAYFNKCRLVEDQQEEDKLAFQTPAGESPKPPVKSPSSPAPKIVVEEEAEVTPIELGDQTYSPDQLKRILTHMIETVSLGELKVPILGTYMNVTAGSEITEYIQHNMGAPRVSQAEQIGQDLVDAGFLRLVGSVGNSFTNSSKMKYQWRPKAFTLTGISEKKKAVGRASMGAFAETSVPASPTMANFTETLQGLQGWNPLQNTHPNELPAERLKREAKEADDKYRAAVRRLDLLRCNLEESMFDHFKFLERCETDRLKAIKSVILDFSGAISNSIPSFQSQVDHMMLYQETIQPLGDLRYLLENYRTGPFVPKVTPYENYYGSVEDQTFGVDLEARARADKKRVPIIVTAILTYLDNHYPDLEGDETRRSIWLVDVPLAATHHLRNSINNGQPIPREILEKYEIPIVASALKLYFMELPDSLVSSQVYEIIKTIYNTTPDVPSSKGEPVGSAPRIKALQSTLGGIRLQNIATLDAIMTHFTRLIDLTSADEDYIVKLAHVLAPCILRPRSENSLTLEERHTYRLVRDLFNHKEVIFGELKRQSSLSASNSVSHRQRAVSNVDESQRRAAMEARARAINQERQRGKSPAPATRHRRDKSTDGSVGRFPVVTSPRAASGAAPKRTSLGIPASEDSSPVLTKTDKPDQETETVASTNGHATPATNKTATSFSPSGPGPHIPPPQDDGDDVLLIQGHEPVTENDQFTSSAVSAPVSSTRATPSQVPAPTPVSTSTAASGSNQPVPFKRTGVARRNVSNIGSLTKKDVPSDTDEKVAGVQLIDKPMDD